MPDKPLTVITYAASASLAAVALVYFFNPNYIIDNETSSSASARKKGVVGLSNPANDCFINSVLQSLAGLRELRLYLIRELHRRRLDSADVYRSLPADAVANSSSSELWGSAAPGDNRAGDARRLLGLQSGEVTQGLKLMLDRLNERPLHKKTISAADFVGVLEHAFATRISKSQQDAQELLQIVAERLSDEYHAGSAARERSRQSASAVRAAGLGLTISEEGEGRAGSLASSTASGVAGGQAAAEEEEDGFPLEGRTESVIECQHCHFTPKANPMSFVMLTLPVPQKSSASLSECFDSHFKTEYIDDYKCDKCRLTHALSVFETDLAHSRSPQDTHAIQSKINKITTALHTDPENPPSDVPLPPNAPTRRIARHSRITHFPNILVVHLSRSIYDAASSSTKNLAKVSFPERLPLGGLVDRRHYKLLAAVGHKGTHSSGHYETFRRQNQYAPTSTPHVDRAAGPYSRAATPTPSGLSSPRASALGARPSSSAIDRLAELSVDDIETATTATAGTGSMRGFAASGSSATTTPSLAESARSPTAGSSTSSNRTSSAHSHAHANALHAKPVPNALAPGTKRDTLAAPRSSGSLATTNNNNTNTNEDGISSSSSAVESGVGGGGGGAASPLRRSDSSATQRARSLMDSTGNKIRERSRRRAVDRWWRISDDKVKECRTGDVLGMQREVYLLFYEIDREA